MNSTLPGTTIGTWVLHMGRTTALALLWRDLKAGSPSGRWFRRLRGSSPVGPPSAGSTSTFEAWSRSREWVGRGKSAGLAAAGRVSRSVTSRAVLLFGAPRTHTMAAPDDRPGSTL